jgi:hypothetical protein
MAFGEKEGTRQGAQPVDLYRIFWGNGSVAGSSADSSGSAAVAKLENYESYTDQPSLEANWTNIPDATNGGTMEFQAAAGRNGTQGMRLKISPSEFNYTTLQKVQRTFTGLTPDATYRMTMDLKLSSTFLSDARFLAEIGLMSVNIGFGGVGIILWSNNIPEDGPADVRPYVGQYRTLTLNNFGAPIEFPANSLGQMIVSVGFSSLLAGALLEHDIDVDNIKFVGPIVEEVDPDETPPTPRLELHYTTADKEIVYDGDTYVPFVGIRTPFVQGTGEQRAHEIDLVLERDHPIATLVMSGEPRVPVGIEVYHIDRQDLTAVATPLRGQVTRYRMEDGNCVISFGNLGTLLDRKLPRLFTARPCLHILGGPVCQVSIAQFTHADLAVLDVLGRVVRVEGADTIGGDEYFVGGTLLTSDGMEVYIEAQEGDQLTTKIPVPGLEDGALVTLRAGCNRQADVCDTRFNNIQHFGGEVGMPDRNPWVGAGFQGQGSTTTEA